MQRGIWLFLIFALTMLMQRAYCARIDLFNISVEPHTSLKISNEQMLKWDNFWAFKISGITDPSSLSRPLIRFIDRSDFKGEVNGIQKEFVSGFATPARSEIIILLPFKNPGFPINGMDELIKHELLHLAVYGAGGANVPLWLNEGMAQFYSDQYPENILYWTYVFFMRLPELQEISGMEFYSFPKVNYPFSYDLVSYLDRRFGEKKLWMVLRHLKIRDGNEEAFKTVLGVSIGEIYGDFRKQLKKQISPTFFFTPQFLFILCALLLPFVYMLRRKRFKRWMEMQVEDE